MRLRPPGRRPAGEQGADHPGGRRTRRPVHGRAPRRPARRRRPAGLRHHGRGRRRRAAVRRGRHPGRDLGELGAGPRGRGHAAALPHPRRPRRRPLHLRVHRHAQGCADLARRTGQLRGVGPQRTGRRTRRRVRRPRLLQLRPEHLRPLHRAVLRRRAVDRPRRGDQGRDRTGRGHPPTPGHRLVLRPVGPAPADRLRSAHPRARREPALRPLRRRGLPRPAAARAQRTAPRRHPPLQPLRPHRDQRLHLPPGPPRGPAPGHPGTDRAAHHRRRDHRRRRRRPHRPRARRHRRTPRVRRVRDPRLLAARRGTRLHRPLPGRAPHRRPGQLRGGRAGSSTAGARTGW